MERPRFQSVDDYMAVQPSAHTRHLEQVRKALSRALPLAEECISYNMPAFRMHGRIVLCFAGFKDHYSIFPGKNAPIEETPELSKHHVSTGTLRFSFEEAVPVGLVGRLAKACAAGVDARAQARAKAR